MNNVECESCVKRKTMYCPNSFKCYATKDKPYWQNRIMLLEENEKLKQDYNKVVHESTEFESKVYELEQENQQLKEQRQELRSWLEKKLASDNYTDGMYYGFKICLSKLNELEGKDENNNIRL